MSGPAAFRMMVVTLAMATASTGCAHRPAARAGSGGYDPAQQIEMLRQLRDKGFLTDPEFEQKKALVLRRG